MSIITLFELSVFLQMTPGEMKFALRVESALNCIPQPEYRQLMVEALMILALVVETYPDQMLGEVIAVDEIVREAHALFLRDQVWLISRHTVMRAHRLLEPPLSDESNTILIYFSH